MKWLAVAGLVAGCSSDPAKPEPPRCALPGAYELSFAVDGAPQRLGFTVTDPMAAFRPGKGRGAAQTRKDAEAFFVARVEAVDVTPVPALDIGSEAEIFLDADPAKCTMKLAIAPKRDGVMMGWLEFHLLVDVATGSVIGTLQSKDYDLERGVDITGARRQPRSMP